MDAAEFEAATQRVNEGEAVPPVSAKAIEGLWQALSSIPVERRQHTAMGAGAVALCGGPDLQSLNAEERVGLTMRVALLEALADRGVLQDYLQDASQKKKVFEVAASIRFDKNDFGAVMSQRILSDSPPEKAEEMRRELLAAGLDPDRPEFVETFIARVREG